MKIAIEGCAHGELDKIYDCIEAIQARENISLDLLICCGDFQSVRNNDDLRSMAVPDKYQNICTFYKYYSGEREAPVLTLFIGGNHEASNYLQELPYGGWVAPKIYYMGRAGVVNFGGLRIGGLSGIFKGRDYWRGLWEIPPYSQNSMRSIYHVRALDVFRLRQLGEFVNVMLSHDWPRGITNHGNVNALLKYKPFFKDDIEADRLGSPPAFELLNQLKPEYWFAAHLHCKFTALVKHADSDKETKFLALDKCLPKRHHLQILDLPDADGDRTLKYDAEWLAILRITNHLLTVRDVDAYLPGPGGNERFEFTPTDEEKENVIKLMGGDLTIQPNGFVRTASAYVVGSPRGVQQTPVLNPQTRELCDRLSIDDPLQLVLSRSGKTLQAASPIDDKQGNEISSEVVVSPATRSISRLSLPPPVTPVQPSEKDNSLCETDESLLTSTFVESPLSGCDTTPGKKFFKRRNEEMYSTPEVDAENRDVTVQKTPISAKKFVRRNQQNYLSFNEDT